MEPRPYPRLTTPLVRDGGCHGKLRPATWDEALDRAASGLRTVVSAPGSRAFGMFSCSKATTVGEPLACSETGVAFAAPEADAGRGDVQVTQGGKTASYPVEAVAPKIEWDCPDAAVGDVRVLSLRLAGASKPADWIVSGDIQVQNGRLVSKAPGVAGDGPAIFLPGVSGAIGEIARFEALTEGKMTALATLRAVRK